MTDTLVDERMSDVDALVWAVEREPRYRTTIAALALLDGRIDDNEIRHRVDRVSRVVPRLRQRVVDHSDGLGGPRWSVDPEFSVDTHLHRVRLTRPDERELLDLVRDRIVHPFDRTRPLWEITVIDGLADGRSALLLKAHHAVTDGVGGVAVMAELFTLSAEIPDDHRTLPPPPRPPASRAASTDARRDDARRVLGAARRALDAAATPPSLDDIAERARRFGQAVGSATRMYRSDPVDTPVPRTRSAGLDLRTLSLPLADLKAAGARVGGTVNDAFVTAVAIGTADHFRDQGRTAPLRVSIPMSTRGTDGSAPAGNQWTPGRLDLVVGAGAAPAAVASQVRDKMRRLRAEPAHTLVAPVAAMIRRLPPSAMAPLVGAVVSRSDLAASNVPGSPVPLYLCGSEVLALLPFGPLAGSAINITMMSHAGQVHLGVSSDPAAVDHPDGLLRDLGAAFAAVVKGS